MSSKGFKTCVLAGCILGIASLAGATPIECDVVIANPSDIGSSFAANQVGILNDLAGSDGNSVGNGCWEGDVFFSNFSYEPTAVNGNNNETPSVVDAAFSASTTALNNFAGLSLSTGITSWETSQGGFTWSYTETLCTTATCGFSAPAGLVIFEADAQESPGGATGWMNYTITPGGANSNSTLGSGAAQNTLSVVTSEANVQSVSFLDSYTGAGTGASSNFMTGTANDVYNFVPSTAPEPTTMALVGGALIGLGLLSRRLKKS